MRWLYNAAQTLGGLIFFALFLTFLVQIAARFGFDRPLPWTDELAVVLYLWVILWAAAFMVPEREHVVFDLVWNSVGLRARQAMAIGTAGLMQIATGRLHAALADTTGAGAAAPYAGLFLCYAVFVGLGLAVYLFSRDSTD